MYSSEVRRTSFSYLKFNLKMAKIAILAIFAKLAKFKVIKVALFLLLRPNYANTN